MLIFHLSKSQHSPVASTRGHGLIFLCQCTRTFDVYLDSVKHFKNRFSINSLNKEAHAKIFSIDFVSTYQCSNIFSKFRPTKTTFCQTSSLMFTRWMIYHKKMFSLKGIWLWEHVLQGIQDKGSKPIIFLCHCAFDDVILIMIT